MTNRNRFKKKNCIGAQLKKTILEKGISVTQFAEDIGISRPLIQNYLADTGHPTDATVKKIADYFGLPIEYFTEGSVMSREELNRLMRWGHLERCSEDEMGEVKKCVFLSLQTRFSELDRAGRAELLIRIINTVYCDPEHEDDIEKSNQFMNSSLKDYFETMIELNRQQTELLKQLAKKEAIPSDEGYKS